VPRRRCAGCGRIAPKAELLRLTVRRQQPGARAVAVRDDAGALPGRGAYLCRDPKRDAPVAACLEQGLRRGGIARTLRAAVTVDAEIVESVG
jgi:predicted RNA-binding protein YlxR (DUF448 family)